MLIIGLLAFYIEEVSPVYWIYQKFVFILGGMLIPLDFFPVWLRNIVRFLPMAYISYFPARLCTNFNGILYLKGFAMQITYILLFIILLSFLFSRGKKRLQVHGG
jgi:ABC-2 type transport system permease protein